MQIWIKMEILNIMVNLFLILLKEFFFLEFLMLTINKEKMLSKKNLEEAFKLFDEVINFKNLFDKIKGSKWIYFN